MRTQRSVRAGGAVATALAAVLVVTLASASMAVIVTAGDTLASPALHHLR